MRVMLLGDQRSRARFPEDTEFITNPDPAGGPFDVIALDHFIQLADRTQVLPILQMYRDAIVENGQIVVVVPSLEWACKEISKSIEPSPMAYLSIYGTKEEPNLCGLTLHWLRLVVENAGFVVVNAATERFNAAINGQPFEGQQNIVIGLRTIQDANNAFVDTRVNYSMPVAG